MSRALLPLCMLAVMLLLAGCNDQSMTQQPKFRTFRASDLWPDGTSARPRPAHTAARGDGAWEAALRDAPPISPDLLSRGRERYTIACAPCHGLGGHGDGMIVQRGFPAPPDYDSPRLRAVPAEHIVDVITQGYGVMYSYAARVDPADRWAIAAYVRALQTAARVPASAVPATTRASLP